MRSGIVSSTTEFFGKILVANLELVWYVDDLRAISTVVAHFLHTEGVTGSNPVLPIKNFKVTHLGDRIYAEYESVRK